jgi:hypothetical protein
VLSNCMPNTVPSTMAPSSDCLHPYSPDSHHWQALPTCHLGGRECKRIGGRFGHSGCVRCNRNAVLNSVGALYQSLLWGGSKLSYSWLYFTLSHRLWLYLMVNMVHEKCCSTKWKFVQPKVNIFCKQRCSTNILPVLDIRYSTLSRVNSDPGWIKNR